MLPEKHEVFETGRNHGPGRDFIHSIDEICAAYGAKGGQSFDVVADASELIFEWPPLEELVHGSVSPYFMSPCHYSFERLQGTATP